MEYEGKKQECEVDHLESNICRVESQIYKVNDMCIAIQSENIKRDLIKNGPLVTQVTPFTDFLPYSEGAYHKGPDSFKFNGYHLVKVVGWSQAVDGSTEWIIENTWGSDWGEKGYGRVLGGRSDVGVDMFALGMSVFPYTIYDYQSMQNMAQATSFAQDGEQDEELVEEAQQ